MKTNGIPREWHVLDFFCDGQDCCALTVRIRGRRFHVIVDAANFNDDSPMARKYRTLLQAYKNDEVDVVNGSGTPKDDGENESGVDMSEGSKEQIHESVEDPETALQTWILGPLAEEFEKLQRPGKTTLQDWYHCPTHFYEMGLSHDGEELKATKLENTPELEKRMQSLIPQSTLPKYITDRVDVQFHCAKDVLVLDESDQPPGTAYHPCRVRLQQSTETCFLKVVDNSQPGPFKREVDLLNQMKEDELQDIIHVPILQGLVYFDKTEETPTGKKRTMGFLQTDIPEATPLTDMLDSSIPQSKRDRWAKEAERIKEVLHENGIVWGDAKADNFMVDNNNNLWIIDFGGSYTEGWVDPELNETQEGDDMGTERIVNALIDPVSNTWDPDEEETVGENNEDWTAATRKRAAEEDDDDNQDAKHSSHRSTKQRRRNGKSHGNDNAQEYVKHEEPTAFCYCGEPESRRMVACDSIKCKRQRFHFSCAGLEQPPSREEKWYCEDCRTQSIARG